MTRSFLVVLAALCLCIFSCHKKNTLFSAISPGDSGIDFANTIFENDSINVLDYEYVYNGGGVGVGDFNRDGKPDIYFAGNMVSNRLYLNNGNMHFTDVTAASGTGGEGKWCNGVTVVDINNDGWPDIFVSTSRSSDPQKRKKILYINQGLNSKGIPQFKNEAAEYGLDDTSYSTTAVFFDYDNDGDLDMFLLVAGKIQGNKSPNMFENSGADTSSSNTSRLYQNKWDSSKGHPYFKNVSRAAGINQAGYGLGVNICDINKDGWKDIFVSNDYLSNDQLWINNHNGTFTNRTKEYFKHTSFSAMGNDVEDLDNDGLCDVVELDMNPADNYRRKMIQEPNSYQVNMNFGLYNYQPEYGRNTLQLNLGNIPPGYDSVQHPVFGEVSYMAGIDKTDWSWDPLVADFDNDGYRDIVVTNGVPKDISDHDFIAYRDKLGSIASKDILLSKLPVARLKNYAFHNNGNMHFTDVSNAWGVDIPSFSNGAAFADLDGDGDLDIIINNIDDPATILKNTLEDSKPSAANYLSVDFLSAPPDNNGIGAWVELHYAGGKQQVYENTPYRGYLSTDEAMAHFGLGSVDMVDSVIIKWPDGRQQILRNVKANQTLRVRHKDATELYTWGKSRNGTLFKDISDSIKAGVVHKEDDFNDFNIQKLLPHKLSDYAPGLAAGDVNDDGLDDIVIGGSPGYSTQILLQQANGSFLTKNLQPGATRLNKRQDETGILLFDADGDGDLDLYVATGGFNNPENSSVYRDMLYINDGHGNFTYDSIALPENYASKFCVRAVDYDNDGDLDLFIAGRCVPGKYPQPTSCFIYRNDTQNGKVKFTDVTAQVAPQLKNIGMTCDAVWTDFNNDGWQDLIIAGEFMPIKFFKNDHGKLQMLQTALDKQPGCWNSIIPGDFDNDGDIDYVVGNSGENTFYRPLDNHPVKIYAGDFDNNGTYDAVPVISLPTSQEDTTTREFPAAYRDAAVRQIADFRRKFPSYKAYAGAGIDSLFSPSQLSSALVVEANTFKSCYIRNDGNGNFFMAPLPMQAQISSLFGMMAEDVDGDGDLDIVINGNDYGAEVNAGSTDALNGLVLKGDGTGNFKAIPAEKSGILITGNGRALVKLTNKQGNCLLAASQNKGPLKVFWLQQEDRKLPVAPDDVAALVKLKSGKTRRVEINYGAGFLSQSARFLSIGAEVVSVEVINSKGEKRKLL
ncbi:MAG TPA: VCBS repeat-containing protein [Chitinophagaceae bacterium]|nr:VCBS repeat-containing protein [Chitinophagaceae bacterium]